MPGNTKTIENSTADRQLVIGLKNGDAACFELVVRNYGGRMLALARRYLVSDADAQDCIQEAYIQAFKNIDRFEGRSSIETWLHRIVVNTALMKLRTLKRRKEESIEDNASLFDSGGKRIETEAEISLSVEDLLVDEERRLSVRRHIDQLPESARNLLLLRDIEGYSTEETARLLDLSISNVKTGLHRGRKLLKDRILLSELAEN